MAATYDQLITNPTFQGYVKSQIIQVAQDVAAEAAINGSTYHQKRQNVASQVISNPNAYRESFTSAVASVASIQSNSTITGEVLSGVTSGNVKVQVANFWSAVAGVTAIDKLNITGAV